MRKDNIGDEEEEKIVENKKRLRIERKKMIMKNEKRKKEIIGLKKRKGKNLRMRKRKGS